MCCSDLALSYVEAHASWREANTRRSLRTDRSAFVEALPDGALRARLAVEGVRCSGCMKTIERGLAGTPGIRKARLNFTDRRLLVEWSDGVIDLDGVIARLGELGFRAEPFDPRRADAADAAESRRLIRALAVAGFASMNIMLLAVSVWAGNLSDITPETRDLFHWIQAAIALPAAAYAGRPFYEGAFQGLRAGRLTMDFPITLGVVLTLVMSLVETFRSAQHAYFDGAVMLLFFLLIGRALDHAMRRRVRALAGNLSALRAETATRVESDGSLSDIAAADIRRGDRLLVRPGERIPADGAVEAGASEIDLSFVTGETAPVAVGPGAAVHAGAVNASGALTMRVAAAEGATLLDAVERLMARALEAKSHAMRLADRATAVYAPLVHGVAALTLVGWLALGAGWHDAILHAVAVLIITCPCALGLAIPAVQVAASGSLFGAGVLLNSGDALERFAGIDTVIFDKTGTLTLPEPVLAGGPYDPAALTLAARLALSSRHPMALALADRAAGLTPIDGAREAAGLGVRAIIEGVEARLGSPAFCEAEADAAAALASDPEASAICFRLGDGPSHVFMVRQALREDAVATVAELKRRGLAVAILSGDRPAPVEAVARRLGVVDWSAGLSPHGKIARIEALTAAGRRVMMVGDGVNDAPALAAATASISPATAAHVSQAAADALFLGKQLAPVLVAIDVSARARRLMLQNLWLSALYNVIAIPVAAGGLLTPLIAALAMSGSSLVVTANALRARLPGRARARRVATTGSAPTLPAQLNPVGR